MAYDIIGNVTDEKNNPIQGVVVSDGAKTVSTNAQGYYEIKTDNKSLNFSISGFKNQTFDLTKYKDGSSVNVDITLNKVGTETTNTGKDGKSPTSPTFVGLGVGLAGGLIGFFVAKANYKSVPVIAGITITSFAVLGLLGYTIQNRRNKK